MGKLVSSLRHREMQRWARRPTGIERDWLFSLPLLAVLLHGRRGLGRIRLRGHARRVRRRAGSRMWQLGRLRRVLHMTEGSARGNRSRIGRRGLQMGERGRFASRRTVIVLLLVLAL